jgi:cell shape-determining protein MreC
MFLVGNYQPAVGTPVIVSQDKDQSGSSSFGVLVGVVGSAVGRKITVLLPTSDLVKIAVLVRDSKTGERQGTGVLVGRGQALRLEQVLTSEAIKEQDLVVTAGDENLPPELLVGYISRVHDLKGVFREAEVKPAVDPKKLDFVFLITRF